MTYSTKEAEHEFDSWSSSYDQGILQSWFFHPAHEMLLAEISKEDRRILDLGCGTSLFASLVLRQFPKTEVVGLDLSNGMLKQGAARVQLSAGRLHVLQGDSAQLPFADNTFDVITCTHSFHHYPRQERVVAEMHRVLRPGGRLLVIDGNRDNWWGRLIYDVIVVLMEGAVRHLSARAFRRLFRRCGFEVLGQRRRGLCLPALLTIGQSVKPAEPITLRRAA